MEPDRMYYIFKNIWYSEFNLPSSFTPNRSFYGFVMKGYTMHNPIWNYSEQKSNRCFPHVSTEVRFDIPDIRRNSENYERATVHGSKITLSIWQPYQAGSASYMVIIWPSHQYNNWIYQNDGTSATAIGLESKSLEWILRLPHAKYGVLKPNSISKGNTLKLSNYMSTKKMAGGPVDPTENYDNIQSPWALDGGTSSEAYNSENYWFWNMVYYNLDESSFASPSASPFVGHVKVKYYTSLAGPKYPYNRGDEIIATASDPVPEDEAGTEPLP